tara:strand:+ start:289 stop:1503 length:1215 start_codon:yes stop_codon:yes gene_type:complete
LRILFLTQWFQPEDMYKGLPFAKELLKKGHDVEVLTGFPNYPSGKVYEGYKLSFYYSEIIDQIKINRTFLYPSHNKSTIKRIINYLSFGFSSFFFALFFKKNFDIIYVYNLVTLIPTALLLRKKSNAKIVLDVQDLWPESVQSSGMMKSNFLLKLLLRFSNFAYKKSDYLTVLSNGFKKKLIEREINPEKISVIMNWSDTNYKIKKIKPVDINPIFENNNNSFKIVFAGTMGIYQGIDTIIDSAKKLRLKDINFYFIGSGVEVDKLKGKVIKMNLSNIFFGNYIPRNKIGNIFEWSDALIVHLVSNPLFKITIPSKTQSYMSAGKPILMGVQGDSSDLIINANCGLCFESGNSKDLSDKIIELYEMDKSKLHKMGLNGKEYYENNLSMKIGIDRFNKLFNEIIK